MVPVVMTRRQVATKIVHWIPPNGMDVVGAIQGIVILDWKTHTL